MRNLRWGIISSVIGIVVSLVLYLIIEEKNSQSTMYEYIGGGVMFGFIIGFLTTFWNDSLENFFMTYHGSYPLIIRISNFSIPTFLVLITASWILSAFAQYESYVISFRISAFVSLGIAVIFGSVFFMFETFGLYVDKSIRNKILIDGGTTKGEQIEASVLFLDIRNSTAMGEALTPERFVSLFNEFYEKAIKIINQHHGIVNKFMGDAILAFWTPKFSSTAPCQDAVNASLKIITMVDRLSDTWLEHYGFAIEIGIGIHYGKVISGNIGGRRRKEFTIMGDTVNTAKRLEELTKKTHTNINVSAVVFSKLEDKFESNNLGGHRLKGKKNEEIVYSLLTKTSL
jgi:adenylate cyclase